MKNYICKQCKKKYLGNNKGHKYGTCNKCTMIVSNREKEKQSKMNGICITCHKNKVVEIKCPHCNKVIINSIRCEKCIKNNGKRELINYNKKLKEKGK